MQNQEGFSLTEIGETPWRVSFKCSICSVQHYQVSLKNINSDGKFQENYYEDFTCHHHIATKEILFAVKYITNELMAFLESKKNREKIESINACIFISFALAILPMLYGIFTRDYNTARTGAIFMTILTGGRILWAVYYR